MKGALLALLLGLAACANPVPPTGGPPDREPPRLVSTVPDTGAVEVRSGVVRLTFSEPIDLKSLKTALSVVPEPDTPPTLTGRGRVAEIHLGVLRDSTTYVVTIDNALRDAHSVALTAPLTFAFSTGSALSRGRLEGAVREPVAGAGVAGVDVYAYAAADTVDGLPARPLYRTQTGADGRFAFQFLGPQPLFVVALRDANRNRRADAGEAFAGPPRAVLPPDTVAVAAPWLLALADTAAPRVERLRSYSRTRHALRFRAPIARAEGSWTLADTLGNAVPVAFYLTPANPREVFLETPPLDAPRYRLTFGAVADSAGNRLAGGTETLVPSTARDTFGLRFVAFLPADGPLRPGERAGVRFSRPLPDSLLEGLVVAVAPDSTETPLVLTPLDGTAYTFPIEDSLRVRVHAERLGEAGPAERPFTRLGARELGGIAGTVAAPDALRVVVEARGAGGFLARTQPDGGGHFLLPGLAPGAYQIRAFEDANGDGRWNAAHLAPYRPAERVRWAAEPVTVRARWDNELADTLRFE